MLDEVTEWKGASPLPSGRGWARAPITMSGLDARKGRVRTKLRRQNLAGRPIRRCYALCVPRRETAGPHRSVALSTGCRWEDHSHRCRKASTTPDAPSGWSGRCSCCCRRHPAPPRIPALALESGERPSSASSASREHRAPGVCDRDPRSSGAWRSAPWSSTRYSTPASGICS